MSDPTNSQLNLNYARQQAQLGDMNSAISAVERLLFNNPANDEARILHAAFLLEIDDIQGAKRELRVLEGRAIPSHLQSKLNQYRQRAGMGNAPQDGMSASGIRGRVAAGLRYDDSAGNALTDGTPVTTTSDADFAVFLQGSLEFRQPIESGNRTALRGGVSGQTLRHETFSRVDYDTLGANLGLSGVNNSFTWQVDGVLQKVFVDNDPYLTQLGPRIQISAPLSSQTKFLASAYYYDEDFKNISTTVFETSRSGDKVSGSLGLSHKLSDVTTLRGIVGYVDKSAAFQDFAYDGLNAEVRLKHVFSQDAYFKALASYGKLKYKGAANRKDNRLYVSGTLGAGLNTIAGGLGAAPSENLSDLSLEGAIYYIDRSSNAAGIDFNNIGAQTRLIWDF